MRYDVAIIGGGPAGLRIAHGCASAGLDTLVIEEHPCIGWPVQCAGVISPRTADMAGLPERYVLNRLRGAEIIGPSVRLEFDAPDVRALVIDRKSLDRHLARRAIRAGADIVLRKRGSLSGRFVRLDPGHIVVEAEVVVGADGPASSVRRAAGIRPPGIMASALQAQVADWTGPDERVVILLDQHIAPGFFAWAIPVVDGARIGCACLLQPSSRPDLRAVMDRFRELGYLRSRSTLSLTGGLIPLTQVKTLCMGNVILAGDAAGQVKPVSGGGVYPLMVAADLAAEVIISHIADGTPLQTYANRWHRTLGRELSAGGIIRRAYAQLRNDEIDAVLNLLAKDEVIDAIVRHGDIDHPTRLVKPVVMRSPRLVAYLLRSRLAGMIRHFLR
jgi:geranylgeranyl reductase family protein